MKKLSNEKMAEICQAIQRVDASRPKGSRIDYVFAKRLQKIFYQLWEGDSSAGDKLVRSIRDGGFVLDEHYYTAVNLLIAKKISDEQFFRFILYCRGGCPDVAWEMFLKAVCDKKISYDLFEKVAQNGYDLLEKGRFACLIIGDKYANSQHIPLGFECMARMNKLGFITKAIIIKDIQGNERAKGKTANLWRYRALAGGFYIFRHEYVMVFQKV